MQYEHFVLAWWFNVGVQIFLCLSGYLYGQKNIGEIISFYGKRFIKILVPYYIVFLIATVLEVVFCRSSFSITRFGVGLVCRTTIDGGEHLWFVPIILFCYVLTPILEAYRNEYIINVRFLWIGALLAIVTVSIFGGLFADFFNPAWLTCYVIGYALGVNEDKKLIGQSLFLCVFGFLAIIGNGIQVYFDYVRHIVFSGYIGIAYKYFQNYNHVWLGIFLFLLIKAAFDRIDFSKHENLVRLLNITDKYSYETYLVHQFLILGPFSLMTLTPVVSLNIIIILLGIGVMAWLLRILETPIIKQLT